LKYPAADHSGLVGAILTGAFLGSGNLVIRSCGVSANQSTLSGCVMCRFSCFRDQTEDHSLILLGVGFGLIGIFSLVKDTRQNADWSAIPETTRLGIGG